MKTRGAIMTKHEPTYQTEKEIFPRRLRELMEETDTTQEKLGEVLGVRRQTISLYVSGQSKPDWSQIAKIARHFGVMSDYLLGISDNKVPENQDIGKKFGLNDKAIEGLEKAKSFGVGIVGTDEHMHANDILNDFFKDDFFLAILVQICALRIDIKNFDADFEYSIIKDEEQRHAEIRKKKEARRAAEKIWGGKIDILFDFEKIKHSYYDLRDHLETLIQSRTGYGKLEKKQLEYSLNQLGYRKVINNAKENDT